MGRSKQLLSWQEKSLLQHSLHLASSISHTPPLLVLGADHEKISAHVKDISHIEILNQDWAKGMGHSLAVAIAYLKENNVNFDWALVLLSDMPLLSTEDLANLYQAAVNGQKTTATLHGTKPGVPVIFHQKDLFDLYHGGNRGAQAWLLAHQDQIIMIDLPAAQLDIDTPEDWVNFLKTVGKTGK